MTKAQMMKYIPRELREEVESIEIARTEYNEHTKRWNKIVRVVWKDDEVNEYQNFSYMHFILKEYGRYGA